MLGGKRQPSHLLTEAFRAQECEECRCGRENSGFSSMFLLGGKTGKRILQKRMTDPWDEGDIYLHEWLICMVNVGNIVSTLPETTFLLGFCLFSGATC